MSIVRRGGPALLALLAGGACSSETINLLSGPGDGGMPAGDAALDSAADAGSPDAAGPADGAGPSTPSACPEVIDQRLGECVSPPVTDCNPNLTISTTAGAYAQVFTPVLDGAITRLLLWMRNADPVRTKVVVSIADLRGDPRALLDRSYSIDGHILATTLASMTDQLGWQEVVFASPPMVLAHRPYAIYARVASPFAIDSSAAWTMYNDFGHPTLDAYPGGGSFGMLGDGSWFEYDLYNDFVFEVHTVPSSCP